MCAWALIHDWLFMCIWSNSGSKWSNMRLSYLELNWESFEPPWIPNGFIMSHVTSDLWNKQAEFPAYYGLIGFTLPEMKNLGLGWGALRQTALWGNTFPGRGINTVGTQQHGGALRDFRLTWQTRGPFFRVSEEGGCVLLRTRLMHIPQHNVQPDCPWLLGRKKWVVLHDRERTYKSEGVGKMGTSRKGAHYTLRPLMSPAPAV